MTPLVRHTSADIRDISFLFASATPWYCNWYCNLLSEHGYLSSFQHNSLLCRPVSYTDSLRIEHSLPSHPSVWTMWRLHIRTVLSPSFPPTTRQVSKCPRRAELDIPSPLFICNRHSQPSRRSSLRGRSSMLHPLPLRLHSTCKKHTRHTPPCHLELPHRHTAYSHTAIHSRISPLRHIQPRHSSHNNTTPLYLRSIASSSPHGPSLLSRATWNNGAANPPPLTAICAYLPLCAWRQDRHRDVITA